jgi:hypothetical protein
LNRYHPLIRDGGGVFRHLWQFRKAGMDILTGLIFGFIGAGRKQEKTTDNNEYF